MSKKKKECPLCNGKGYYIEESDALYGARKKISQEESSKIGEIAIKILRKELKEELPADILYEIQSRYINMLRKLDRAIRKNKKKRGIKQ